MLARLRNYMLIGAVLGFFYFLLANHFLFFGFSDLSDVEWVKKRELTFKNTFCSVKQQSPEAVLRIADLREAGVGHLMIARGLLDEEKLRQILLRIEVQRQ